MNTGPMSLPAALPRDSISPDRLVIRPTLGADAQRALDIRSDWAVTRMLRMASFPPDLEETRLWFAAHPGQWLTGEAYRFAMEADGRMVGIVDVDGIGEGEGTLGYWLERSAWGRGYAFEAAHAVTRFAFERAGLSGLKSGHAVDNPASGRVLDKLGFVPLDIIERFSRPRGEPIRQRRYRLVSSGV